MLKKEEWTQHIPNTETTVYIEHEGCSTRNTLAITNKGNVALAWCHKCRKSGIQGGSRRLRLEEYQAPSTTAEVASIELPPNCIDIKDAPPEAQAWLLKYGIAPDTEGWRYSIKYDTRTQRVVLPVYRQGVLHSYQMRAVLENQQPKYIGKKLEGTHTPFEVDKLNTTCVITEDTLSAIKVGMAGYNSIALGGVHLHEEMLDILRSKCYTNIIIWLDNDNPEVKLSQYKVYKRLSLYATTYLVTSKQNIDPKECSVYEIQETVKELIT